MRAAIASAWHDEDAVHDLVWWKRPLRWLYGLLLLPLCWVTGWTFLSRFSTATVDGGFWQTAEFWYFAVGILLMAGWFASGLMQKVFLYLYVLGHELTHALCVMVFLGKVSDFHVSTEGGYITTNKTNWVIALSPYFVPFWSVVATVIYFVPGLFREMPREWQLAYYGIMGVTWTFHMVWTLWMIPRDQPDLREHGVFLSLVLILFANVIVLAGLFCLSSEAPWQSAKGFGKEWLRHAATWGDIGLRWCQEQVVTFRAVWKL